jgi:hypothetical protein
MQIQEDSTYVLDENPAALLIGSEIEATTLAASRSSSFGIYRAPCHYPSQNPGAMRSPRKDIGWPTSTQPRSLKLAAHSAFVQPTN